MHKRKKRLLVIGVLVLSLIGLFLTPPALAEEKITVPQDAIKSDYFSQLTPSQLAKAEVTVPKSWVKESYFETESKKDKEGTNSQDSFAGTDWRWGLEKINAPQAWENTKGEGVVVAVIDGGVNFDHPALQGKAWSNPDEVPGNGIDDDDNGYVDDMHGWDFIDDDPGSRQGSDFHSHGTSMADVIAGKLTRSGRGGVAPKVKVMDLRIYDEEENLGSWDDFEGAFRYALEEGADVVNFSIWFGYETSLDYYFERAVRKVASEILIVGIAGNESSSVQPPATMEEMVAVTATNRWNRLYSNANTGPEVMFAAPGVDIVRAEKVGYGNASGTSDAAPHVVGVAALMLSIDPDLKPEDIINILSATADDLGPPGRDEKFGWGLVDAEAAVEKVKEAKEG